MISKKQVTGFLIEKLSNDGLCQIPENLDEIIYLSLKNFH
jgi:hypothetical protein